MIYITGDCHGDFRRFNKDRFPIQTQMTKEDCVIICGDFGAVWNKDEEDSGEKYILDGLDKLPFTVLFVDGNHENFDRLYDYPVEEWKGGKVHRIRPSVIHLMRGQVFILEGKKFFTFGGASSHDVTGGILEPDDPDYRKKKARLNRDYISYRVNHYSWWKEELPSEEEMEEGRKNLSLHGNKVDYIISHCCATSTQILLGGQGLYKEDKLTDYFEKIRETTEYQKWCFGHYHINDAVTEKDIVLYENYVRLV